MDPSHDAGTVERAEVERFQRLADSWWDPAGAFAPLHLLNPLRLGFIRSRLERHFGRDERALSPFAGLSLLDIGCGGGLIAEPMARLGFDVTAIDADATAIAVARAHAADCGLAIDYRTASVEDVAPHAAFDAVLALEIVEHVRDLPLFLAAASRCVKPGGALILSTINRTARSYLLAIVAAEHVLGWLPRGTHRWEKLVRPSQLAAGLRPHGMAIAELCGMAYAPWRGWSLSPDLGANYLLIAIKPK